MFYTTITINLKEIERTRRWLEYNKADDVKPEDLLSIDNIDKLYKIIEEITGGKPNLDDTNFTMQGVEEELALKCNYYLNNIQIVDVLKEGEEKLTDEEKKLCKNIMHSCTYENSNEVMMAVASMDNFYLRTYTEGLLLRDDRSNYKYSYAILFQTTAGKARKLERRLKKIRDRELSTKNYDSIRK